MLFKNAKKILLLILVLFLMSTVALAATTNYYTGITDLKITYVVGDGTTTVDNSAEKTLKFTLQSPIKRNDTKFSFENTSQTKTKVLKFNYTISDQYSYSGFVSTSAAFEEQLDPGESVSGYTVIANALGGKAYLTLSNISYEDAATNPKVTINYDSNLGSVTCNGAYTTDGTPYEMTTNSIELVAATKSDVAGAAFVGWFTTDNEFITADKTLTQLLTGDFSVKAVFTTETSNAMFLVGKSLYNDLNDAATYAAGDGDDTVILIASGVLPADTYTIPSGVTLLIPFDDANTCYADTPEHAEPAALNVYRKLTMAESASINVEGTISVSAKHSWMYMYAVGRPSGNVGVIDMEQGSAITVKNGGTLYAWGYIIGNGTVTAESGADVYELMQIADYRGGDVTSSMNGNENGVLLFSHYYVQNIEVPLTLEYGADEYLYLTARVSGYAFPSSIHFVGTEDALFLLGSGDENTGNGSLTKTYLPTEGRLKFETNGVCALNKIAMSLQASIFGSVNIDSSKYVLPIHGNMAVEVASGITTINYDVAILPGAKVTVDKGAEVKVAGDLFVYALNDPNDSIAYCYDGDKDAKLASTDNSLTTTKKRTATDLEDAILDINGKVSTISTGYLYTTAKGANITSSQEGGQIVMGSIGTATVTYQATQSGSNFSTNVEVPVTSAKLKNADTTYVETANSNAAETLTYTYTEGKWKHNGVAQWDYTVTDTEAGTTTSYSKLYTKLANAVTAYDGTGYIQMLANTNEPGFTVSQATTLDLAGKTVELTSELINPANLSVIDSATNGFDADGGKIVCSAATTFPTLTPYSVSDVSTKYYITVDLGSNTYAFPRVASILTRVQYSIDTPYLLLENTFRGNSKAASVLQDMGFSIDSSDSWLVKTGNKTLGAATDKTLAYYGTIFDNDNGTTVQPLLGFGDYGSDYPTKVPGLSWVLKDLAESLPTQPPLSET